MPRRGGIAAVGPAGPARSFADGVEESPDGHVGSHCEGARIVGAAVAPLAKDVSLIRRGGDCSFRHGRKAVAAAADPTMAFLRLWTRKEAVLKLRGTGIRGFGSMVEALQADGVEIRDLPCDAPDTVAALALAR